ncbi:MAG: hypothetical protein RPU59_15030 [Candidatus Sedimenticola sp. (ex Thyasira tokunagai)]
MPDIKDKIIAGKKSENFLNTVYKLCLSDRRERSNIAKSLVTLHNTGKINVVAEFLELKKGTKGHDFFLTRHVFEELLPDIDAQVEEIMRCVKHLTLEAGNDGAAGMVIAPFIEYLKTQQDRPVQALEHALKEIDDSFDFITPTIIAGADSNFSQFTKKAIELTRNSNSNIRTRAVHAIGRLTFSTNPKLIQGCIQAITEVLGQGYDEMLFSSALRSSYSLLKQNGDSEDQVKHIFETILAHRDDYILHVASEILFSEGDKLPLNLTTPLLNALADTKAKDGGTIDNIDYGLEKLFKAEKFELVFSFLESFLLDKQSVSITQFDSVSRAILKNQECLNELITRWLLSKRVKLGRSASDLLPTGLDQGLHLSADAKQLSHRKDEIHIFLARKACSWFFTHQISAASYLLSLIEIAPEDEIARISEILFNPLLVSYPGSVKEFLEKSLDSATEKCSTTIRQLLTKLEKYHSGLDATKDIKELRPSLAHREAYHRHHSRLMNKSYEEAQNDSIWRQIATSSMLLYGRKSIYYVQHGADGQSSRQETPLQQFNYSVEFPSVDILDHTGLEYLLRSFKLEGCTS